VSSRTVSSRTVSSRTVFAATGATLHGHGPVLAGLWRSAADTRLAHGLLFDGPDGIGKFFAATRLAQGLLCAHGPAAPCGTCPPCKRFTSGNHADLFVLDPEGEGAEQIAVNWIRPRRDDPEPRPQTVEAFLSLKASEGGWRVVLVRAAERLNLNAQNALLKTLEEPGHATLLVLVTARPDRLLDTVQSRMVRVGFGRLSAAETAAVLAEHEIEASEAQALQRWSRCAPGRALALAGQGTAEARALFGRALQGELPALEASAAVWDLPGTFVAKTPRAGTRLRARAFFDLGIEILADLGRVRAGIDPDSLAHGDLALTVATEPGGSLSSPRCRRLLDEWLELRQDVDANLAPEGLLDRAFLALERARTVARDDSRTPPARR